MLVEIMMQRKNIPELKLTYSSYSGVLNLGRLRGFTALLWGSLHTGSDLRLWIQATLGEIPALPGLTSGLWADPWTSLSSFFICKMGINLVVPTL